jgi:DNA-binding response OmpR family regulator
LPNKLRRVLVVDDEGDIRTIVGLNLGLNGMEFGEAKNGEEAIAALLNDQWDACVLDLAMPGADGFDVLHALSERGKQDEIVIVILSARGDPSTAIDALTAGAHAHLTKPFSPGAVAHLVEELMELSPAERADRRTEMMARATTLDRLGVEKV